MIMTHLFRYMAPVPRYERLLLTILAVLCSWVSNAWPSASAQEVNCRAVIPRARSGMTIDGRLTESDYATALCTPLEFFHTDQKNRPARFCYLWDNDAFYVGLRTLDQHMFSPQKPLWEGDAVEWYFDTRRGPDFLSRSWGPATASLPPWNWTS
jgi:hypothetical protein